MQRNAKDDVRATSNGTGYAILVLALVTGTLVLPGPVLLLAHIFEYYMR